MDCRTYIYRVLKQVHPDTGCTAKSMTQFNQIVNIIAENIINNAIDLCKSVGHITVSFRDIQSSVRLLLPTELANHAVGEGTKAVTKYNSNMASSDSTESDSRPRARREYKAGLQFPVARCAKLIKDINRGMRVGQTAPVYLASVLEYLMAEILVLSGNTARDNNRVCITPRHVLVSVGGDDDLTTLFQKMRIHLLDGGVLPNIHDELLPTKNKTKKVTRSTTSNGNTKKPHRFRPGTVALREIRRYQKTTDSLTQFAPFERYVRTNCKKYTEHLQFAGGSLQFLHEVMEHNLVDLLTKTQHEALHANRTSINPKDIHMVHKLSGNTISPASEVNDEFIVKNAIVRLARRAGVKRIESTVYDDIRSYAAGFIKDTLKVAITLVEHRRAVNVTVKDLQLALRMLGYGNYVHTHV